MQAYTQRMDKDDEYEQDCSPAAPVGAVIISTPTHSKLPALFQMKNHSHGRYIGVSTQEIDDDVVKHQPVIVKPGKTLYPVVNNHFLTLSIVLSLICLVTGTWYSLLCTVPAIFIAVMARRAEARGNLTDAHNRAQVALIFNIVALIVWIVALIIIVLSAAIVVTSKGANGYSCKIDQNYNYYECDN